MGWLSAVGVCQSLHRELLTSQVPRGAGLPGKAELRKGRSPSAAADGRIAQFFQAYIDNYDEGEIVGHPRATARGPSAWQGRVRDAYRRWGAARAEDKSAERAEMGATLGGVIDGSLGTVGPADARVCELLSIATWALQRPYLSQKAASFVGGK